MKVLYKLINCALAFLVIGCSTQTQVLNLKDSPIPSKAGIQTMQSARQNIIKGMEYSGWKLKEEQPGIIGASFSHQEKLAIVDIVYRTNGYDILYKDSKNLNYYDNRISHLYNRWVLRLDNGIRKVFLKEYKR